MLGKKRDEEINAFLGKGAEFSGKLFFNGSVRIDGDFHGEILGGGTLVVGEGARVRANINIDSVLISGGVHGHVDVKERLEIFSTGKLVGNVKTPIFVIKEGGIFEGTSRMGSSESETGSADIAAVGGVR
ncbi:MAG: polymer-forming cytoskeletal protein [Deltaproteobacteria bacterium]|nr:polymer-forming cytoskeletal protein [Deltaproteobacteria bacterium]